jgi:hypothetical protein
VKAPGPTERKPKRAEADRRQAPLTPAAKDASDTRQQKPAEGEERAARTSDRPGSRPAQPVPRKTVDKLRQPTARTASAPAGRSDAGSAAPGTDLDKAEGRLEDRGGEGHSPPAVAATPENGQKRHRGEGPTTRPHGQAAGEKAAAETKRRPPRRATALLITLNRLPADVASVRARVQEAARTEADAAARAAQKAKDAETIRK